MKYRTRSAALAALCLLALVSTACTFSLFQIPTIPALSTQLPEAGDPDRHAASQSADGLCGDAAGAAASRRNPGAQCPG